MECSFVCSRRRPRRRPCRLSRLQDGNRVEFQVENFATEAELNNYIRGEAFAANPIGTGFDPERLLERYRRGDPVEELVLQGSA
jgi:hypothetical protein